MSDWWLQQERAGDRTEAQERRERGEHVSGPVPPGYYVTGSPDGVQALWCNGWDEIVAMRDNGQAKWRGCHGEPEGWEP